MQAVLSGNSEYVMIGHFGFQSLAPSAKVRKQRHEAAPCTNRLQLVGANGSRAGMARRPPSPAAGWEAAGRRINIGDVRYQEEAADLERPSFKIFGL